MSFLNKIKGWGQDRNASESTQNQEGFDEPFARHAEPKRPEAAGTMPLEVSTVQQTVGTDSSIITEAAPSEMADFSETRIQGGDAANDMGSGLPLIGTRPVAHQKILTQVGQALRAINRQSSDLLETAETISSLKLQQEASPAELSAVGQLVMLTQRIGKSANEFLTMEGVSPEAVFLLGKDLNSFKEIAQGLLDGSPELRLAGSKDPQTRERLEALMKLYEQTRTQAGAILGNLQGLVSAREAQAAIIADSEPLRGSLEILQGKLS